MKKNKLLNALVLAASLVLLNTSCEIGLGASVDTQAPTLSILYPDQASVIREDFIIAGECDDDQGVTEVKITVQRTDTGKAQTLETHKAEIDVATGKWQAKINEYLGEGKGYNGWKLPDGKYVANVTAVDESGRDSGIASLTFDIDNTAPIFIIKSPTSRKITSPTGYGTSFKVTGTMTDDHTVSKMTVKVYDDKDDPDDAENPPTPIDTIYESNIDTTTEIVIANRNREGYLKDRYEEFYKGANEGDNRALWCTVQMEDNARIYRDPDEEENETQGNITNRFYIVDEVNSTWSNSDKEMDPGKVKKIVNRTATGVDQDLSSEVMRLYNESYVTKAAFSINSDSNPTYEIRNYGNSLSGDITKAAAAKAELGFALSPGRNGDNVCPSTVKIFLWGPFDNPLTEEQLKKVYSSDISVIEAYAQSDEMKSKFSVLAYMGAGTYEINGEKYTYKKTDGTVDINGAGGSVPTYDRDITLPDSITTTKIYYISAYAMDLTDAIANPSYKVFAFKGHSNGQPPVIKWENTAHGTNTAEDDAIVKDGAITYSGYASYPDGIDDFASISYRATIKEIINDKEETIAPIIETPITNIIKDEASKKVFWTFTYDGLSANSERICYYDFTVTAKGLGDTQGHASRRLTIDTQKPVIEIKGINPIVETGDGNCLNGTFSLDASIKDKNLKKVWYQIKDSADTILYTSKDFGDDTYSLSQSINTTLSTLDGKTSTINSANNSAINIVIYAEDKPGNRNSYDSTTQNGGTPYILKQDSDKPVVKPNFTYDPANTAKASLSAGAWYDKGAKLNFNVTDDDGLSAITVKKDEDAAAPQTFDENTKNATINYELPKTDGVYQITLVATDNTYSTAASSFKTYRQTTWGPFTVGVDTAPPTLKDDKSYTTNYAKDAFTLTGTLSDANGIASIQIDAVKKGSSSVVKTLKLNEGITYTAASKVWSATIAKGALADGEYTFTTTAKDYAGNTSVAESVWTIDTVVPAINSAEITTAHNLIDANSFSKENIDIKVAASDATSGIDDIQYSLDGTNWTSLTPGASFWTATVNCAQGSNSIRIKAIDSAKNESAVTTLTAKVDTIAPSTDDIKLVSVAGEAGFSGTKMVNGSNALTFVVSAIDDTKGTGVASVKVSKIGTTAPAIEVTSGSSNKYTITIPTAKLASGTVKVVVTDKAGNASNEVDLFEIDHDGDAPVVEIKDVTPIATLKNDSTQYLNGKITITGRISDANLSKKWCEVYSNNSATPVITTDVINGSEPGFSFVIDTTNASVTDGKAFYVKVWAEDKAGNKGSADNKAKNFIVSQDTDKPQVEGNNFENTPVGTAKESIKWFDGGDKLLGTVSDDDDLSSIKITTVNSSGTTVDTKTETITESRTANISYALPAGDGVYKVTIVATDSTYTESGISTANKNRRITTYGPFLVGVDTAAPVITENSSTGTNIVRGAITLGGTATDTNGIKQITVSVKNTKTNAIAGTYTIGSGVTLSGSTWSCSPTLADGIYLITTTAEDYAGKTATVESSFVKDNVKPTVNPTMVSTGSTIGGKTWFTTSTSVDISATATDATSGVVNVQYSLDGNNWSDFKKSGSSWTATVKCEQGANTISVKSIDDSGLESDVETLTANIDTAKPETPELVSVDSVAGFTGVKMVKGNAALPFVVKASDGAGTGVKSVAVTHIDTTVTSIASSSSSGDNYTISIPAASLKSGAVEVTVTDNAGNKSTATLFTITVDNTAPTVTVSSVTPVVTSGSDKLVNGTIKVTAKINDTYLSKVWYEIKVGGVVKTTSPDQGPVNAIEIPVDTTAYAQNSTLEVTVYAEDKAGNQNSANASSVNGSGSTILFKVDQTSDRPVVTPSNFTYYAYDASKKPSDIPSDEWFNASGNNKVIASVTDDDALKSVVVGITTDTGAAVTGFANKELVTSGTTPSTVNVNYVLPSTDGVYKVTITAKDTSYDNSKSAASQTNYINTYGPFIVGVDTTAPEVTEDNSTGTNYRTDAFSLSGTATDTNGIRNITVSAVNMKTSAAAGSYSLSAGTVTYTEATGKWTCSIPASLADGKYKFTVTAEDCSGKTSSVESIYVKDTANPTVSVTVNSTPVKVETVDWYTSNTIAITATASDAGSGVSTVEYSTDEGTTKNWTPLRTSDNTNWTANVTCANQGANKIFIKATDEAGREGKITNDYITVNVDSKKPEVCTLFSIDGEEDFNTKKLANGKSAITFVIDAADSSSETCTGLKTAANGGAVVTKIGITTKSIKASSDASGKYTITIPAADIISGTVNVTLYDKVGNSNEFSLFSIDKDTDAPTITIDQFSDADDSTAAIDVNNKITFSGTAGDTKDLDKVMLFYAIGTKPTVPSSNAHLAASWTGWTALTNAGSKYSWKAELNTASAAANDKKNLYFYAVAVDTAGNATVTPYSATEQLYINQDSDRPKIILNNLALTKESSGSYVSAMESDKYYWHREGSLQGRVEDDDGTIQELRWKNGASGTWSDNIYRKGTWTISNLAEGSKDIYFKVKDAAGNEFISAATGMKGPKVIDSNEQTWLGVNATDRITEILKIKVDTEAPEVGTLYGYVSASATYDSTKATTKISELGTIGKGTNKYLFVKVTSSDGNGINAVTLTLGGKASTKVSTATSADNTTYVAYFDLSAQTVTTGKKIENKALKVVVEDKAGKSYEDTIDVTVDNVVPVVSFTESDGVQVYGSESTTINGRTDDASIVSKLSYAVSLTDSAPAASAYTEVKYTNAAEDQIPRDNWSIIFDDDDNKLTTALEFHTKHINTLYKTLDSTTDLTKTNNVIMYLWIKAEDEVGNTSAATRLKLNVIPNSNIPRIDITYPTGDKAIGGNIRITGTVEVDSDSIDRVYLQIDPAYNGTAFNASGWATALQTLITQKGVTGYKIVDTGLTTSGYEKGILVTGTSGWSQTINTDKEFEDKVGGNNRTIALRAFAVTKINKNLSVFSERVVPIDPNSPLFGQIKVDGYDDMQLVKYASGSSGTVNERQKYTDDINLKGQWYLSGSISDESGIKNATVTLPGNDSATQLITAGAIVKSEWVSEIGASSDGKGKNFKINIPVGSTTANDFGNYEYVVWIQDGSGSESETERSFKINFDNKAPEFAVTTEETSKIYQSNGTYTLAGTFDETSAGGYSQSGFERIVMYFTNTRSGKTNLIDPMISKGASAVANREEVSASPAADGLYWIAGTISGVTSGEMTVTKLGGTSVSKVDPKVRAGGLCKVNGVIYRIKYTSGATVVLDNGNVVSTDTTVYFARGALVIDNPTVEGGTKTTVYDVSKTATSGKDDVQTAGDGDQMMEKASSIGSRTNWSVSIDSTQIRDGQVTVHLVAFDKAGNSTVISHDALVMNNAPRFAGVKFGSDMNSNGSVSDDELITEFAEQYVLTTTSGEEAVGKKRDGTIVDELDVSSDYRLPVKRGFKVIPVIVGGNDGLTWKMTYKDTAAASVTTAATDYGVDDSSDVVRNWGTDPDAADYKTANDDTFKIEYDALALLKLNNKGIASGDQELVFTIEDKTEGGAIPATLTVPVTVMLADNSAPVAKWKPLYWKSSSDNSLYNNSQSNGHIELAEDWANSSRKSEINYGTNDADSKVSGIISMEGYATDNVLVNSITVNVDDTNYTLSRNGTGWTTSTAGRLMTSTDYSTYDLVTNPWYFEVVSDSFDSRIYLDDEKTEKNPQYGYNIVTFKFHWNTSKLLASNKKAKKDVQVSVTASDKGPTQLNSGKTATEYGTANKSTVGTAKTTKDAETNLYQLDVVPYITKVYTELAALQKREAKWSKTSRTSNGAYPVRITTKTVDGATGDCETVSFYGFNLTGAQYTDGRTSGAATTTLGTGSKLSYVTAPYDVVTLSVDKIISSATSHSGEVNLAVDGVYTINNVNNNDAKGSVTAALTDANCGTYGYNRQPNSDNNKKLTDDVRFDVWQINGAAATPGQGRLDQPVMSINPVTDWIGFGFADGPATFSMGGSNKTTTGRSWSYYQWQMSYDQFTSIAFAYDAIGHSYGTAAGGDISSDTLDRYVICTSRGSSAGLALNNTYQGTNSTRLEKIGQNSMDTTNKQRIKSPSIATATHGGTRTNIYLAYYDAIHGEIRLRYGSATSESADLDGIDDFTENNTDVTNDKVQAKNLNYKSIIANTSTVDGSGNDASAGEYLSIAVISAEGTATSNYDDKLAAIWYNPQTKSLWYSYNASPSAARASNATTGNRGSWSTPVRVFAANSTMAAAGQYCKMVADKNGGLHIAAYDPENLDLCYAYLAPGNVASATTAKFNTAVVDSKDVVGSNLSIDVALDAAGGNPVPSIGYYATESGKPMYAYLYNKTALTDTTGKLNGAVKDMYTGTWECSAVPTGDVVDLNSKQFNMINVGLHKTAITGVLKASAATTVTQTDSTATYNHGLVFGNGTNNAVLGYAVKRGGGSNNVETAQKR